MKKYFITLIALLLPLVASAQTSRTIHVATAGTLSNYISEDEKYQIEELTLSGELNGTDFRLIRDMAGINYCWVQHGEVTEDIYTDGKLKTLNLSGVKIVEGGIYYQEEHWLDSGGMTGGCSYSTENNKLTRYLFYGTKLKSIILPISVSKILASAFYRSNELTSIIVDADNEFYDSRDNCNAVIETQTNTLIVGCKNTIIPNNVTSIGNSAFEGCSGLTSLTIPSSVTSIGNYAFYICSGLESISVESGNTKYDSRNNCNAIIETQTNTLIAGCKNTIIPNNVTSIGRDAFSGCRGLTSLTLPNSVTSIGEEAFYQCSGLISLTLPSSVTTIGGWAFYGCSGLTTIISEIETPFAIDEYAFYCGDKDIYATATLIVPPGKKSAYQNTAGWNRFQNIVEAELVGYEFERNGIRYKIGEDNTVSVVSKDTYYSGDISIPYSVYYGNKSYTVTSIGNSAFEGCENMTSVSLPSSLKNIGDAAFWECSSLKSVVIPDGVTTIGEGAFRKCSNLVSVVIPNSVTSIGNSAFGKCSNLSQVISLIQYPFTINSNVFTTYSTTTLVIPKGTKSAYQAKSGWNSFTNIYDGSSADPTKRTIHVAAAGTLSYFIPDDEKYLVEELTLSGELNGSDIRYIWNLSGLDWKQFSITDVDGRPYDPVSTDGKLKILDITNAKIVEGGGWYYMTAGSNWNNYRILYTENNSISEFMFEGCKFMSIKISNSVTSIGSKAFNDCGSLTNVTIPNSVTNIDNYAFSGCSGLTTIVSEIEDPFTIDDGVFPTSTYYNASLIVPVGKKSIYQKATGWSKFQNIVEVDGVSYEFEENGIRYKIGENNTVSVTSKSEKYTGDIVIPSHVTYKGVNYNVTSIGGWAFLYCSGLTSVTIPNSVTSIGGLAFCFCTSLTSITIPKSMTSIGNCAFEGCTSLTSITIPNGVTSIGEETFMGCSGLTSVKIPYSVTSIGIHAFAGCSSLTSFTIPNSVTSIGDLAFSSCSGLTSITIPNGVTSIGDGAFSGCSGLTSIVTFNTTPPTCTQHYNGNYIQFNSADKTNCIVWVPRGSVNAYKNANGWKDFQNIRELNLGDVNIDFKVDKTDLNALIAYIMGEAPEDFNVTYADLNGDDKVNAADVVKLITILNIQEGLGTDWQFNYNSSQVVSSLSCTLNNNGDKAIQLTKCELYNNNILVSSAKFNVTLGSGGSKSCTFNELSSFSTRTGFSVVWHYTYNGESYTYSCDLTE